MDFLATPTRRVVLFAALYFSEGAPIGFLWFALPTQLRAEGVPVKQIAWLGAVLVLPWTLKFLWAPLVDWLRTPRFTLKHWILLAQSVMGLMLLPLLLLDMETHFPWIAAGLLVHAFAAATQDVAIDALCISTTSFEERGRLNGWMQAGMLIGRASMGGGALILAGYVGDEMVVGLLIGCTTFSMLLVAMIPVRSLETENHGLTRDRAGELVRNLKVAVLHPRTWWGLLFALIGGAAFEAVGFLKGPYLIDHQFTKQEAGFLTAVPYLGSMILGALLGGRFADRFPRRVWVAAALVYIAVCVNGLALWDWLTADSAHAPLFVFFCLIAFGIGWFTAASYALFMDLSTPAIAATQFSAFMGATNACESWSVYSVGVVVEDLGYPVAFLCMSTASLLALPILFRLRLEGNEPVRVGNSDN